MIIKRDKPEEHIGKAIRNLELAERNIENAIEHFAIAQTKMEKSLELWGQMMAVKEFAPEAVEDLVIYSKNARKTRKTTSKTSKRD